MIDLILEVDYGVLEGRHFRVEDEDFGRMERAAIAALESKDAYTTDIHFNRVQCERDVCTRVYRFDLQMAILEALSTSRNSELSYLRDHGYKFVEWDHNEGIPIGVPDPGPDGFIDSLRISEGARYTEGGFVPTPFTRSPFLAFPENIAEIRELPKESKASNLCRKPKRVLGI